jgi:hypothetical protein
LSDSKRIPAKKILPVAFPTREHRDEPAVATILAPKTVLTELKKLLLMSVKSQIKTLAKGEEKKEEKW